MEDDQFPTPDALSFSAHHSWGCGMLGAPANGDTRSRESRATVGNSAVTGHGLGSD